MFTAKNSWIEQIYQYIEHYYWCPQDLTLNGSKLINQSFV
ncbi:hypothetical protein CAL7102_09679 [Dulcicalothrix desertica PCC 7102]|nr:hypothetical protein CAL7102_09679 [Dulcicalothrix desertica PCC 7102]